MMATVRLARLDDLEAIVDLHMRAFPRFFLSTLGRRFLSEVYRGFLRHHDARVLVAEVNGSVAGFAAGTLAPERFFRDLVLARWFAFGWAAMGAALRRPRAIVPRLISGLFYRGEPPRRLRDAALLSSIAVEANRGRSGIGTMLLTAYCEQARMQGLRYVYLTTDRIANDAAIGFYLRHGFHAESEIRRSDGRMMIRYVTGDLTRPGINSGAPRSPANEPSPPSSC